MSPFDNDRPTAVSQPRGFAALGDCSWKHMQLDAAADTSIRSANATDRYPVQWWRGGLVAVAVIVLLSACLVWVLRPAAVGAASDASAQAETITVCPSGCMYTSIETALENAVWGSTVMVGPGEYNEWIWLRGGIRVQGAGPGLSFIIWSGQPPAVAGYPHDLTDAVLDGFTIICDSPNGAIHIDFPHEKQIISNNVISNSVGTWHSGGIYIASGATPIIINNVFYGNTLTEGDGGGAILINDAAPIVTGNTFIGNSAKNGGAIAVYEESSYKATITDNTFLNNTAQVRGGAIYVQNASPSIRGNQVYSNTAFVGGGICAITESDALIEDNDIAYNSASGSGSAGGGIYISDGSNATLDSNFIRHNSAEQGAGVYIQSAAPGVTNNVLAGNYPAEILINAASPHLVNNTIVGTQRSNSVGIDLVGSSSPTIANNIIAFEAYGIRGDGTALPAIRYNDLWMNSVAHYNGVTAESSNLSVTPGLQDVTNGDYHLQAGSALIDAGTTDSAPSLDFEGDLRVIDGNGDGIARPDIGADEYSTGPPTPTPTRSPLPPGTRVTVTLEYGLDGYYDAEDTYIYKYAPDSNYCTDNPLSIGYLQQYAALLRFDVSAIPLDAVVVQAMLQVYAEAWGEATNVSIGAYYITRTVDLCQATWNQARSGNAWASPGANSAESDRRASAESSVTTSGIGKWYEFDLSAVTQGWIDGSLANNGVLLRAADSTARIFFSTRESGAHRPKLVIIYQTAGLETATPTATATRASPTPTATSTATSTRTPALTPTLVTPTLTPAGPAALGDVNGDGRVNSADALIILSADVGVDTSQFCPMNCGDVDGNGSVNSTDALVVLCYDVGMAVPYPVGTGACPSSVTPPAGCNP